MQRMLDLIESTLDADITPAELAEKSGYSLWHFLHLFQQQVGMPLGRYVARRRLVHAISQGMNVTDAALRWGFGSHSGFWRACGCCLLSRNSGRRKQKQHPVPCWDGVLLCVWL